MTGAAALLGLAGAPGAWPEPRPDLVAAVRAAVVADERGGAADGPAVSAGDEPAAVPAAVPAATVADLVPALLAAVPDALARHARLGLPAEVTRDTLADVGRKVAAYGAATDTGWLVALLRADVVALGRLQLARVPVGGAHAVHVPEGGPLTPAAVDESLARAAPVLGADAFTCESWLLDPLLPAGLPAGSNIVRFAARFALPPVVRPTGPGAVPADHAVAKFVFRRPLADVLAAVTPATRLERLVAAHLRGGGHWTEPVGTLAR